MSLLLMKTIEVFILEVGVTFDYSLEEAFLTKVLKCHQLEQALSQLGYIM